METYSTSKGQIVIPSALRRKYGIKTGTKILIYDDGESIILKPVTEQYLKNIQGSLNGKNILKIYKDEIKINKEKE